MAWWRWWASSVSFDKTTFRLLARREQSLYMLAKWENGAIDVDIPENLNMESPTVTLIYDERVTAVGAARCPLAGETHSTGMAEAQWFP